MTLRQLESEIAAEAREVAKRPKLRVKDILAWSTTPAGAKVEDPEKEEQHYLPRSAVYVVIPK